MECEANAMERGTIGVEDEEGGTIGALVVTTPALSNGTTMMDEGATTKPAKAASTLTSAATGAAS